MGEVYVSGSTVAVTGAAGGVVLGGAGAGAGGTPGAIGAAAAPDVSAAQAVADAIPNIGLLTSQFGARSAQMVRLGTSGGFGTPTPRPVLLLVMEAAAGQPDAQGRAGAAAQGTQNAEVVLTTLREPGVADVSYVRADIPQAMAQAFRFALSSDVQQQFAAEGAKPVALQLDRAALPGWLKFDPETLRFSADSVPAGALPVRIQVIAGKRRIVVELTASNVAIAEAAGAR